jgi:hypothetical protein
MDKPINPNERVVHPTHYNRGIEMWDYAQLNIGKKNYDIDHWLSSFSVFALIG